MTNKDDTDSVMNQSPITEKATKKSAVNNPPANKVSVKEPAADKQLSAEVTELLNQFHELMAVNEYQRELIFGCLQDQEFDDQLLKGFTLTNQWQNRTEQQFNNALLLLRKQISGHVYPTG